MSWQANTQTYLPYLRPEQLRLLTKDIRADNQRLNERIEELRTELDSAGEEIADKQQQITTLNQQVVNQSNTIAQQNTQIQNQANTIGQQNQQISALQTTVTQLQAQGRFPLLITKLTTDTTITPGTIVVMSFPGGASQTANLFTYTIDGDTTYRYGNPAQGAVTAILVYQPSRSLYFLTDRDSGISTVDNCNYLRIDYNATYNNSILSFT